MKFVMSIIFPGILLKQYLCSTLICLGVVFFSPQIKAQSSWGKELSQFDGQAQIVSKVIHLGKVVKLLGPKKQWIWMAGIG